MADTNALIGTELKTFPGAYFGQNTYSESLFASDDSIFLAFQCPEACDLTGAMARCTTVTGTSPYYTFELFAVTDGAYGIPTGSALATTSAFQASLGDVQVNFTSAYTCSQGQVLCVKISYASGTIDSSNHANFLWETSTVRYNLFPYAKYWNGSAWTGSTQRWPTFAVQTDISGVDFGGIYNINDGGDELISTGGDRFAQRIDLPDGENLELHVDGFRFCGAVENSGGADVIVGVWPASGSALASATISTYQQSIQMDQNYSRSYYFTSSATLTSGNIYYIGFEHTGGGAGDNINVDYSEPGSANGLKSWPGGDNFYASKYSSSSWTDDVTKRLLLNPILSSVHGSGGGGSSIPGPSMGVIG